MTIQLNTRFNNKVIIVTGAASGIGKAIVNRLVSEGGNVIGIDINKDLMIKTISEIKDKKYNGNITYKILSVSN
jgi:NAD(P)-dependent dehydrogenase (short-subunit alcohol dehydrogenase family)